MHFEIINFKRIGFKNLTRKLSKQTYETMRAIKQKDLEDEQGR